jgi:UDP-N-acetylmuramoyl-tripeptide--D-alanyl-D-alanine ligase
MSMRAALDELAATAAGRRVAVLGDMLELGPGEVRFHEEIGAHARERGVDLLVTVGPRAAHMAGAFGGGTRAVADAAEAAGVVAGLVAPGDTVLVKASRGVGLEAVTEALQATRAPA